jgi:hypothetical protein
MQTSEAGMIRSHPLIALALAFPALAVPAGAQIVGSPVYPSVSRPNPFLPDSRLPSAGPWEQSRHLRQRIDRAREAGLITRREARQLRRGANVVASHGFAYGLDGFSNSELVELESRMRAIESAIVVAATSKD